VRVSDSRAIRLISGSAIERTNHGTSRLSEIDSRSIRTSLPTCAYRQYEFNRHRNPRSAPPDSTIFVERLRLVARVPDRRSNTTSCSVS
jgi:hypothetical protein